MESSKICTSQINPTHQFPWRRQNRKQIKNNGQLSAHAKVGDGATYCAQSLLFIYFCTGIFSWFKIDAPFCNLFQNIWTTKKNKGLNAASLFLRNAKIQEGYAHVSDLINKDRSPFESSGGFTDGEESDGAEAQAWAFGRTVHRNNVFQRGHHKFLCDGGHHVSHYCSAAHFFEDFDCRRAEHNDKGGDLDQNGPGPLLPNLIRFAISICRFCCRLERKRMRLGESSADGPIYCNEY
ncbi:hypothetical protein SUGI_0117430 [Cryptomeria japonica]|nr:hypothetical protein SUGI_0117430 [Cryptomeria japonica]